MSSAAACARETAELGELGAVYGGVRHGLLPVQAGHRAAVTAVVFEVRDAYTSGTQRRE